MGEKLKITFVCAGNTCRSPMLQFMFANYAAARGLCADIASAGIRPQAETTSEETEKVLLRRNIPFEARCSRPIDKVLFDESDFVFAVDEVVRDELIKRFGKNEKLYCLEDLCECPIEDPYKRGEEKYDRLADLFDGILPLIYLCVCGGGQVRQ